MRMRSYLRGHSGDGILTRLMRGAEEEKEQKFQQTNMAMAMKQLANAKDPKQQMTVLADYVGAGGDLSGMKAPLDMMQPDKPDLRSVRGGLYDVGTGDWVLPPQPDKPSYSHLREINGGLYNMATGQWEQPPLPNGGKEYKPPSDFGADVAGYTDERMGVQYGDDGTITGEGDPLDPEVVSKIRERAYEEMRRTGNPETAMRNAYDAIVGDQELVPGDSTGIEKDGSGMLWDRDYQYMRPKSSVTREGGGRAPRSSMVTVTNGKETLRIPADRLEEARKDGFDEVI